MIFHPSLYLDPDIVMTVQTNIPPNVPDALKVCIYQELDADLNGTIFDSLLQGLYTGIVVVTLWNICKGSVVNYIIQTESNDTVVTSKSQHIGRVMTVIIILLHGVTTVNFAVNWSDIHSRFVDHRQSFWTKYLEASDPGIMITLGEGIMAAICTILADSTIIWRCWIVWGQRWLFILPPVFLLISATRGGAGGGLRAYHHVLEVLVESSALYSISLILCTAFFARNIDAIIYFDTLAGVTRGIAPTLIVGRVAAGHARSEDLWQGSVISGSLRFGSHVGGQSSLSDLNDLEAQRGGDNEYVQLAPTDNQKDTADDQFHTLTGTQEDIIIDLEGVVREDHMEIDVGKPADGHFL
ncbi:hypothetical protein IW262DRAFT_1462885 [Armillaria fumosa]|nr:hypothetical protein IW262DRAFT_1462885 [Armillaria fumosa]